MSETRPHGACHDFRVMPDADLADVERLCRVAAELALADALAEILRLRAELRRASRAVRDF